MYSVAQLRVCQFVPSSFDAKDALFVDVHVPVAVVMQDDETVDHC